MNEAVMKGNQLTLKVTWNKIIVGVEGSYQI